METVLGLPAWQGYLIIAAILVYTLVAGGWALAKAGRSPLWVMFLLIPYANVIAIWAFAYIHWPFVDGKAGQDAREPARDSAPRA